MPIWINNNKIVVNTDSTRIAVCDECPCSGECCSGLPETITISITSTNGDSPCSEPYPCNSIDGDYELTRAGANCCYSLSISEPGACGMGLFESYGWHLNVCLYSQVRIDNLIDLEIDPVCFSIGPNGYDGAFDDYASSTTSLCSGGTFEASITSNIGEGEPVIIVHCNLSITVTI